MCSLLLVENITNLSNFAITNLGNKSLAILLQHIFII